VTTNGRVIKLFDPDDNRWTIDLKMKIEVERSSVRKMEHDYENMSVALASTRNNIAIIRRSIDFLRGEEAKIVIMAEYHQYRSALPKLLREETDIMNAMTVCQSQINIANAKVASMLQEVDRLRFKVLEFRRSP
jgi:predicted nuclease with TOPRIM domain